MDKSDCSITAERAVLVVVDIQERLASAMQPDILQNVIRNTGFLIASAKELGFPVLVTEQYPKGLGPTVEPLRQALEGIDPIEKLAFSCCGEAGFVQALEALGDRDVILAGMETHVCLLQTAIDLLADGRRVFVAADAICSRTKQNWRLGLNWMERAGAWIGSTEILLFQMLGKAGTPQFKAISRIVK